MPPVGVPPPRRNGFSLLQTCVGLEIEKLTDGMAFTISIIESIAVQPVKESE